MALNIKITVHIGPNAQSGGFQLGWINEKYHSSNVVREPPKIANDNAPAKETKRGSCFKSLQFLTNEPSL